MSNNKNYSGYILFKNAYKEQAKQPDYILYDADHHRRGGGWKGVAKNGAEFISIQFGSYPYKQAEDLDEAIKTIDTKDWALA